MLVQVYRQNYACAEHAGHPLCVASACGLLCILKWYVSSRTRAMLRFLDVKELIYTVLFPTWRWAVGCRVTYILKLRAVFSHLGGLGRSQATHTHTHNCDKSLSREKSSLPEGFEPSRVSAYT